MRLVCVCPNPAIDHTMVVPRLDGDETVRAVESLTTAGGKGLNVARFARGFGARATAVTWLGELGAEFMHALARRDGLDPRRWGRGARAAGSRLPVLVLAADGSVLVASDPISAVDSATWANFVDRAGREAVGADAVCVSGSFPRVAGLDPVRSLLSALGTAAPLWVDTSGDALVATAEAFPAAGLKINLAEAGALVGEAGAGHRSSDRDRALSAART